MIYEVIGYVASVLVAISLMMSSIVRLRVLNLLGSATFTVYGLLIASYPVAGVNAFVMGVNIYYLRKIMGSEETFRSLEMDLDSEYLRHFIDFHRKDINRYFPGFALGAHHDPFIVMVVRDAVPAGVLVGTIEGETLEVHLDYVVPEYRDFKVGKHLFDDSTHLFTQRGIRRIVTPALVDEHDRYLTRVGFSRRDESSFERPLS